MKTIGIFVDVSNIYYCVNKAFPGRKVDYLKYLDEASKEYTLYRVMAFGVQSNPESAKFVSCLKHLGYDPRFKKYNEKFARINSNVALSVEVFKTIDKLDIIVIGSADPNLVDLVTWIKDRGIEVHVLACGIPFILKEAANRYTEITDNLLEEPNEVTSAAE